MQKRAARRPELSLFLEDAEREFRFPEGLLGFPAYRRFFLSSFRPADGSPSPFYILKSAEEEISFPLIQPELVLRDYRPAFGREVLKRLEARSAADLAVFVIATLRGRMEDITVNLAGPVLLNPASGVGVQLVLESYPVRYPLLEAPLQ